MPREPESAPFSATTNNTRTLAQVTRVARNILKAKITASEILKLRVRAGYGGMLNWRHRQGRGEIGTSTPLRIHQNPLMGQPKSPAWPGRHSFSGWVLRR